MRPDDYKRELDSIHCTPEFKAKMTDLLTGEPSAEYEDSVSHVEQARKISFTRYAAMAASAVVILGIGGAAVVNLRGNGDPLASQDVDNDALKPYPLELKAEMTLEGTFIDGAGQHICESLEFSEIPESIVREHVFVQLMDKGITSETVTEAETPDPATGAFAVIKMEISGVPYDIDFLTKSPLTYTVDNTGYSTITQNGKTYAFQMDAYDQIMDAVCRSLTDINWSCFIAEDDVLTLFEEHMGEFEYFTPADDEEILTSSYFAGGELFGAWASLENEICISYLTTGEERVEYYYRTPDGFCQELWDKVFAESNSINYPDNFTYDCRDEFVNLLNSAIAENPTVSYLTGMGDADTMVVMNFNADFTDFIEAAKGIDWGRVDGYNSYHDFYFPRGLVACGRFQFMNNLDCYDMETQTYYVNQDKYNDSPETDAVMEKMRKALIDIAKASPKTAAAYDLLTGSDTYTRMDADITVDYDRVYVGENDKRYTFKASGDGYLSVFDDSYGGKNSTFRIGDRNGDYEAKYGGDDFSGIREYGKAVESAIPAEELLVDEYGKKYIHPNLHYYNGFPLCGLEYQHLKRSVCYHLLSDDVTSSVTYNEKTKEYSITMTIDTTDIITGDSTITTMDVKVGGRGDILSFRQRETDPTTKKVIRNAEMTLGDGTAASLTYN